jgi:hypothetical protein
MTGRSEVGAGVRACALVLAVAACAAALPACEPRMSATAVFVEVYRVAPAPAPDRLLVTWLDARQVLLQDQTVPPAASWIPAANRWRSWRSRSSSQARTWSAGVLLLGMRGDQVVCRGAERLMVQPRAWVTRAVPLSADQPADGDNDGMPDTIDNCQGSDFLGCPAGSQSP